ncbi:MAG: AmmeMemoRadiSam system protein B, partial [Candidatus Omnitrophota bacterium]
MRKRIFLTTLVAIFLMAGAYAGAKYADLAGQWYPASSVELRSELEGYFEDAQVDKIEGDIIGVVAPHAGTRASGAVAAYAYKALMDKKPDKVIVVGFTHGMMGDLAGRISVLADETFVTPLGKAPIDMDITNKLLSYSENIQSIPKAFYGENSVEMEVPFIQYALKDARL